MSATRTAGRSPTKLGLGCVALGQDYGRAHPSSRPTDETARELLESAAALGIGVLDTAPAYGDSESRIGRLGPARAGFGVVSKVSWEGRRGAEASVKASLEALRVPALYGVLAHSADELLDASQGVGVARFAELARLRDEGRVERIGASVYTPDEARRLLDRFPLLDAIQLPMSVLDQRFKNSGLLAELAAEGIEVHARSLLLQGALVMQPDALPAPLASLRPAIRQFRERAGALGLSALEAAVGFVCAHDEVRVALIGATTPDELQACVAASHAAMSSSDFAAEGFDLGDAIDPRSWEGERS